MSSSYPWIVFENWFVNGTLEVQIIGLILAVVISILAVWLTIEILKLTFWLVIEILKLTFLGLSILFITLIVVFITAPIGLIFNDESLSSIINNYVEQLKQIFQLFYPKLFTKAELQIQKLRQQQPKQPEQVIRKTPIVQKVKTTKSESITRNEEMQAQTVIISHPKNSSSNDLKFFCTSCGSEFTERMKDLLSQNSYSYCEHCGKKFNNENNLPIPA